MQYEMVVLSMVAWLTYASFLSGLGIWYSIACRTTLRATTYTLSVTTFLGLGPWSLWMCCFPFGMQGSGFWYGSWYPGSGPIPNLVYVLSQLLGTVLSALSPPNVLYHLSAPRSVVKTSPWEAEMLLYYFGLFLWAMAAVSLWSITRRRFRRMTARMPYRRPLPPADELRVKRPRDEPYVALPAMRP
jgi:hypothetical protein